MPCKVIIIFTPGFVTIGHMVQKFLMLQTHTSNMAMLEVYIV